MSNEILEPCPFCGADAFTGATFEDDFYVMCCEDQCGGMVSFFATEASAVRGWNTRTQREPRS